MDPTPGVYPRDGARPTSSEAERRVWTALAKGLPPGFVAWHALRLRDRRATFGEGDFVLAHPDAGILILEVKGGRIALQGGRWSQNGAPMREPPLDQAHRFRNLLLARLRESGLAAPSIGVAACFPDADFDVQPGADDVAGLCLGAHHLRWLGEALPALVRRAIPPPRRASPGWPEALHRLWGESWLPALSLGGRARDAEARRLALDADQLEVLEGLLENERVLVQGGAGSGKTLLAAEAARRHAGTPRRTAACSCSASPRRCAAGSRRASRARRWTSAP